MTSTQKVVLALVLAGAVTGVVIMGQREPNRPSSRNVQTIPPPTNSSTTSSSAMTTTASGLKYRIIRQGSGTVSPSPTDRVLVHYHGTLLDGTIFDSSIERGKPLTFPVDSVIAGWTEGIQLMKVGDVFQFEIPPHLGYETARSRNAKIPPNSTLLFEVQLLGIN